MTLGVSRQVPSRPSGTFEPSGLTPYHHAVLAVLAEQPREAQGQIADALGFDRSHLVGVLDELEQQAPNMSYALFVYDTPDSLETLTEQEVARLLSNEPPCPFHRTSMSVS